MPAMLVCGVINWDVTLFVEKLPRPGEEVRVVRTASFPGGKGGNTAVAAARILGPAQVGIIGMLGSDDTAERQLRALEQEGVNTSCVARQRETGSGTAYVIVDSKGEDMILTDMAANLKMNREFVSSKKLSAAIDAASATTVTDPPIDVASALLARAKKAGRMTTWSPATLVRQGLAVIKEHAKNADYLIFNEHEAALLASAGEGVAACRKLSRILGTRVVTTRGSRGCIFCQKDKEVMVPAMDLQSYSLKAVSTAGAGDTFTGVFGAMKVKGLDDVEALFMANIAAAIKTTKEETRGSPTLDEVIRYRNDERMRSLFAGIKAH